MVNPKVKELVDLWHKEVYEFETVISPRFMAAVKTLSNINKDIHALAKQTDTDIQEVYKLMDPNNEVKRNESKKTEPRRTP